MVGGEWISHKVKQPDVEIKLGQERWKMVDGEIALTSEEEWAATGECAHCERHPQRNEQIAGGDWNGEDFSFEDYLFSVLFCVVENWKEQERSGEMTSGDWRVRAMAYGPLELNK